MLRSVRIAGIVVFAFLVGFSANDLWKMYKSGNLMERYNSRRKAEITLLGVSVMSLTALGFFEIAAFRAMDQRRGYGGVHYKDKDKSGVEHQDAADIYAAPQTVDKWHGRKTRTSRSRRKQPMDLSGVWMGLLRVLCIVLPLVYLSLSAFQATTLRGDREEIALLLLVAFSVLGLLSIVGAIGIFSRRRWALPAGYLLAVCNLVVFPFGTVVGLLLLVGLAGAAELLVEPGRKRRRDKGKRVRPAAV